MSDQDQHTKLTEERYFRQLKSFKENKKTQISSEKFNKMKYLQSQLRFYF